MPAVAAALPDAVIRLVPDLGEMLEHRTFQRPAAFVELELGHPRLVKRINQFAIDVELQLRMGGIADPHRQRALIAGQPVRFPFQQAPLAFDAVHDLHIFRRTRHRTQQPVMPGGSLAGVTGVHQRQQREGGVAQPAEAVVPVPGAAELFRQRRRRCRNDAAGRGIGQRLQRDQRAHHQIATIAIVGAMAAPFGPVGFGIAQGLRGIDRHRHRQMRGPVSEHERHDIALADLEFGNRREILAAGRDRGAQHCHVLPANRQQARTVIVLLDPGNVAAESEADHQLHPHLHPAPRAAHQPHHIGRVAARRHEIDQFDCTVRCLEPRFQDQGVAPIAARRADDVAHWRDQPAPMLVGAEQSGKTGIGIKCRPA